MKIRSTWLRWTMRTLIGIVAAVLIAVVGGSGYLWYAAYRGLVPSAYKPDRSLLSYADEPAPAPTVRAVTEPFSWDTIDAPPRTAMPWVRWWWPGADVEDSELARDLQQLHDANFGGAEVQPLTFGVDNVIGKDSALHALVYDVDSPRYLATVRSALAAAERLGLQIDLTHYSGWPGGSPAVSADDGLKNLTWSEISFSGGRQVEINIPLPKPRINALIYGAIDHIWGQGLAEFDPSKAKLMSAVVAHPLGGSTMVCSPFGPLRLDPNSIQLVDVHIRDGKLSWNAPAGKWVLVASWLLPSGEQPIESAFATKAYTVNAIDSQRVRSEYNYVFGARTGYSPFYNRTLRGIFNDSIEFTVDRLGAVDILEEFRKRRGYDLRPFLPAIYVDGADNTYFGKSLHLKPRFEISDQDARVRYDYQLTLSDLMIERFYGVSSQWAKERGLVSRAQPYGFGMDVIRAEGATDIPETEQLESRGASTFLRAASSAGMLYGHPLISAESLGFQGTEYSTNIAKMKASADLLFINGVNHLVYHGHPYDWRPKSHADRIGPQGWEPFVAASGGLGVTFAENYSARVPLWADMKAFNTYVARAQNLLRQGQQTADVLIFYPAFDVGTPLLPNDHPIIPLQDGHFPLSDPRTGFPSIVISSTDGDPLTHWLQKLKPVTEELDRRGLTWQWVNSDGLRNQLNPEGKTRSGSPYGPIVFAELEAAGPEDLAAAEKVAAAGKPVFFLGSTPTRQFGYLNAGAGDESVRASVGRLTKLRSEPPNVKNLVDAIIESSHPSLMFYDASDVQRQTRALDHGYIDLFANLYDQPRQATVQVIGNEEAWWFDALTGTVALAAPDPKGLLKITLRPYESRFLIRGVKMPGTLKKEDASSLLSVALTPQTWPLSTWDLVVGTEKRHGALFDWRDDQALRYDADQAIYTATLNGFKAKEGARYLLRVGLVPGTASLRVNGKDAGSASLPPGDVDVTPYIHDGNNLIQILYRPSPRNTQIGLAVKGDKRVAYLEGKSKALIPAGLLGPISLAETTPLTGDR